MLDYLLEFLLQVQCHLQIGTNSEVMNRLCNCIFSFSTVLISALKHMLEISGVRSPNSTPFSTATGFVMSILYKMNQLVNLYHQLYDDNEKLSL